MPITDSGLGSPVIGPGFTFSILTDLIGPIPTNWIWEVRIFPHGTEDNGPVVAWAHIDSANDHTAHIQLGPNATSTFGTHYSTQYAFATGDLVDAHFTLWNSDFTVAEDSGATNSLVWDTDASTSKLIATGTATLDTEQAQQLADVHNLVAPPFTTAAGVALPIDISDLVRKPALKFLGIDTTVYTLTGQGTLSIPTFAGFPTAWGLVLDVTSAPSGWGRKPGYVDSFNFRIGQFLLLLPAANGAGSMVVAEYRLHLEHVTWIFPDTWATDVAYYIDPPCEVQARFLTAFTP